MEEVRIPDTPSVRAQAPAPLPAAAAPTADTSRPIRFLHRGRVVEVEGVPPTTTVLEWLRGPAGCTGTKEGCNEGDCGACMVVVAELDPAVGTDVRWANLNACLLFLPALDGRALFTVEDLRSADGPAHPVQQAMVDHHASQCGFCTPGFVMTIWSERERALRAQTLHETAAQRDAVGPITGQPHAAPTCAPPDRRQWCDALAGNLCRCTGYRPLIDAAMACTRPTASDASALGHSQLQALGEPLRRLRQDPDLAYSAYDAALGERRTFHAPRSSDALAAHLQRHPRSRLLGGATDVALWVNKGHRDVGDLVFTGRADDLLTAVTDAGCLRIGGAASLETAWSALERHWPTLRHLWRRFASPPVRHAGTMGGNVANGSPIGDGAPVLMALGARLVLRLGDERRRLALEDFYLGYQRNALQPGEFIEFIEVPSPESGQVLHAWKVSKRYDSDISAVCGAFHLHFESGRLTGARIAFGGMAAIVKRAGAAEAALLQCGWCTEGVARAQSALAQDFQPLDDLRASAAMRLQWAQALLDRLWWSLDTEGRMREGEDAVALEVWR